jgi:hypothetical protein
VSTRGPLDFDDPGDRPDEPGDAAPPEPAPPEPPPPAKPLSTNRYTWFLGIVAILLIALVTINSLGSEGVSSGGPNAGEDLIVFAVPLASAPSRPDEDANVDRKQVCDGVRGAGVLNLCTISRRGPVALALFPTEAEECRTVLAQFDRVARQASGVQLVAVGSRGDRAVLRGGHAFPVGWDKDGAVASLYGLVGCPQITFAERGGKVVESTRSELTDRELVLRLRRLGA